MIEDSGGEVRGPLLAALERIFRALARLCLRHGISFESAAEVGRRAFVEVARREFVIPGRKQSASRIALLTGLHRKDVGRMLKVEPSGDPAAGARVAYGTRVIAAWRRDPVFLEARGGPATLAFDQGSPCFLDLVRRHGGRDLPGRAVLDELVRVGAVVRLRDGRLRLVERSYIPAVASAESIAILGSDVSDLIAALDHNLAGEPGSGFFQRRVSYDNIPTEAVAGIHTAVRRAGQPLLERLDRVMARKDRDASVKVVGTGRHRVMTGIYFFTEEVSSQREDDR